LIRWFLGFFERLYHGKLKVGAIILLVLLRRLLSPLRFDPIDPCAIDFWMIRSQQVWWAGREVIGSSIY
jgi:hypothetical protein